MKEEKSKNEKIIGMVGFISIVVIITGLLIIIWTQPWIITAKLVLSGCVGFLFSAMWFKGNEANKAEKRMNELDEKRGNRKTFQERLDEIKERDSK